MTATHQRLVCIDERADGRAKANTPTEIGEGVWRIKPLAVTYSCMQVHTTIGAAAFHFRVRDGIGWDHSAMAAREGVEAAQKRQLQEFGKRVTSVRILPEPARGEGHLGLYGQAARLISTRKLNALLHFHTAPINHLV